MATKKQPNEMTKEELREVYQQMREVVIKKNPGMRHFFSSREQYLPCPSHWTNEGFRDAALAGLIRVAAGRHHYTQTTPAKKGNGWKLA